MAQSRFGALRSDIMLLVTALIWGSAFVAQDIGADYLPPFSFNTIRLFVGGIVLLPVILLSDRLGIGRKPQSAKERRDLLIGGVLCGLCLSAASNLQQIGINADTSAGKAGFITAMYIVLVPVISLFLGKKSRAEIWISIAIAVVGLYLLCVKQGFSVEIGDIFLMLCALCYAFHILIVGHFSKITDGVRLSCLQFFVAGLSGLPFLLMEAPAVSAVFDAKWSILYAGVMSCGVGYTLQILAQRRADPTVASLLMSMESAFSVLIGWIILGETLTARELVGCALILCAVVLSQLPPAVWGRLFPRRKEKTDEQ